MYHGRKYAGEAHKPLQKYKSSNAWEVSSKIISVQEKTPDDFVNIVSRHKSNHYKEQQFDQHQEVTKNGKASQDDDWKT